MGVFIKGFKVKGIKNLNKTINLEFTQKDIKKFSELSDYNIKAVYGPNGSGKTAIIHAFTILNKILLENNYLTDNFHKQRLKELLNKNCNQIELSIEFYYGDEDEDSLKNFIYEIVLDFDKEFKIIKEFYGLRRPNSIKTIFKSENGKLVESIFPYVNKDLFANIIETRSVLGIIWTETYKEYKRTNKKNVEDIRLIIPLYKLSFNTQILLDDKDEHFIINNRGKRIDDLLYDIKNKGMNIKVDNSYNFKTMDNHEVDMLEKEKIKKLEFIQMFKPNIKNIEINRTLVKETKHDTYYNVSEMIDYGDYKIDLEFESVGIKKIFNLYDSIKHLSRGGILIVDELDSHINDVYLIMLIEYVYKYSKGQLIFTTHNTSPMNSLKKRKKAIDFLSISGKLTTWTQVGNYNPENLYKQGNIEGLPFNISPENFLRIFTDE